MFSTAIVVFREVLEVAIILSVILVATRGVNGRTMWAVIGIALGILGSLVVAYFINEISSLAEGVGQEIFNAIILIIAAAIIGWTVLWMKAHARVMTERIKHIGKKVQEGDAHLFSISLVIALAFLREGSEIVLFSKGILLSGKTSFVDYATGAALGFSGGVLIGYLMYIGLIRISTKYMFKITSWLLIFLAAGMASNAAQYLAASGIFETLVEPVWNSSSILPDDSFLGRFLGVLIGYTAMPLGIQLAFYLTTLGILTMSTIMIDRKYVKIKSKLALAALIISLGFAGTAEATKKVYSPYVEKGELELEYRGNYEFDNDPSKDNGQNNKIGIGYGFTNYWFSEVYGEYKRSAGVGNEHEFEAIEWENKFQLTEPGENWADLGLLTEYEIAREKGEADAFKLMLLIAKDSGNITNVLNIGIEKHFAAGVVEGTEGLLSWSTRYRLTPELEPGFELHSNFGELRETEAWKDQKQQLGPVIYGELPYGFKYDVGYLFGITDSAPDGELKLLLEYEINLH
jgi:high-affinity iron transporter